MHVLSIVAATAAISIAAAAPAAERPGLRADARLARALEGRTRGTPVDCINLRDIRSSEIIDRTAILYRTTGNKLYVNRPTTGQRSLRRHDTLVTDTHSSRLCSIDVVRLYDTSARMQTGVVGLGAFEPYLRTN